MPTVAAGIVAITPPRPLGFRRQHRQRDVVYGNESIYRYVDRRPAAASRLPDPNDKQHADGCRLWSTVTRLNDTRDRRNRSSKNQENPKDRSFIIQRMEDNVGQQIVPMTDGFSVTEPGSSNFIIGKMLKYIDRVYVVEKTEELPKDSLLVAINVVTAWVEWRNGKPVAYRVTEPGQLHPDREDLGDRDEATWELGLDGQPADPWHDTRYLHLIDPLTGRDYTFITDTVGGRLAIGDLKRQIGNVRHARPGAVPLVKPGSTTMRTNYGPRPRPDFIVVEWRGGLKDEEPALQIAGEDEIPF